MTKLNISLPSIPVLYDFRYRHYYITRDKTTADKYYLFFLEYEPAAMEVNDKGYLVAYQKFGHMISSMIYCFQPGQEDWKYFAGYSNRIQRYSEFCDALLYHNFTMEIAGLTYDANPYPGDQPEFAVPHFPAVPNRDVFKYKHYYIVQNKYFLETYYLHLLEYEPVSFAIDNHGFVTANHKFGSAVGCAVYSYTVGQDQWRWRVGYMDRIQNYEEFKDAMICSNMTIQLQDRIYEPSPYPGDGLVPAMEPCSPRVPNLDQFQYKHYYIVQDKWAPERYCLHLIRYEPAALKINSKDDLVAYSQYGSPLACNTYYYTVGQEEWRRSADYSEQLQPYREFEGAYVCSNFTMDLETEHYEQSPYPGDGVVPAVAAEFPPVPTIVNEEDSCRYYILTQYDYALEYYNLYLLQEKPADIQVIGPDHNYVQFLNREGQEILIRRYYYTAGTARWQPAGGTVRIMRQEMNELTLHCNFDILYAYPGDTNNSHLCKIPGHSYQNDGTGVPPVIRDGFTEENNQLYYYADGRKQRGEAGWLYLNSGRSRTGSTVLYADGSYNWALVLGRRVIRNGKTYYFDASGKMVSGVVFIHGDFYSFESTGELIGLLPGGTDTYKVLVNFLTVREKPSADSPEVINMLEQKRIVVPLPKDIRVDASNRKWIEVYYQGSGTRGKTGWVRLDDLEELHVPGAEGSNKTDLYIVTDPGGCRLRNDNHETIELLNYHRVLKIKANEPPKTVEGVKFICVYYDGDKTGWVGESLVSKVDSSTEQYTVMHTDLTADEVHIVGTIIAETLNLSVRESKACAHTILNRRDSPYQWNGWSLLDICNSGEYHGATNDVYKDFDAYYKAGRNTAFTSTLSKAWMYEQKLNAILPVIREQEPDFTDNAVYFSMIKKDYHGKQVLTNEDFEHMFFKHEKDK